MVSRVNNVSNVKLSRIRKKHADLFDPLKDPTKMIRIQNLGSILMISHLPVNFLCQTEKTLKMNFIFLTKF